MNTHKNEHNELIQEILNDKRHQDKYKDLEINIITLAYSDRDMESLEKLANENGMGVGNFVKMLVDESFEKRNALTHLQALQKSTSEASDEQQKQSVSI